MLLLLSCDCTAKMVIFISKKYSNVDFTRMHYHRDVDFTWQSANNEFREQVTWTFCYLSSEINTSAVLSSREININFFCVLSEINILMVMCRHNNKYLVIWIQSILRTSNKFQEKILGLGFLLHWRPHGKIKTLEKTNYTQNCHFTWFCTKAFNLWWCSYHQSSFQF